MKQSKFFNICRQTTLVCFEITAVILLLSVLAIGFLYWRVTTGPVKLDFAIKHIEKALEDPSTGYSVKLGGVALEWGGLSEPLELELKDVALQDKGTTVLNVDKVDLGLSARALASGRIAPIRIILSEPVVKLIRGKDNSFSLSIQPETAAEENAPDTKNDDTAIVDIINMLSQPQDEIDPRSPIKQLELVMINNAKAVIEDHVLDVTWFLPGMNLNFARANVGLEANVEVSLPTTSHQKSDIQLSLLYDRDKKHFMLGSQIENFNPDFLAKKFEDLAFLNNFKMNLNGEIQAIITEDFELLQAEIALGSKEGSLYLDGIYDDKLSYSDAIINAEYNQVLGKLNIKKLGVNIEGLPVSIASDLSFTTGFAEISGPIEITADSLKAAHIDTLWPTPLEGEGAEEWAVHRLEDADMSDLVVTMDFKAAQENGEWVADVTNIIGDVSATNIDLNYHATLLPIRDGQADIHYENDTLRFDIGETQIGSMTIDKGIVTIENVSKAQDGMVTILADLSGSIKNLFEYIAEDPIGVTAEDMDIDLEAVKGNAEFELSVTFPTLKSILEDELVVKADGHLIDVTLPGIVKGMTLTSPQLSFGVKGGAALLAGKGQIDGKDVDFDWIEYFNPGDKDFASKVKAKFIADKAIREKFGIGIEDWLSGDVFVDLTYTEFNKNRSLIELTGDLKKATLLVGPFDYQSPPEQEGTVSCQVEFGPEKTLKQVKNLKIETPTLKVEDASLLFTQYKNEPFLMQGEFPNFTLEDNALSLNFQREINGLIKLDLKGPFLDARPFLTEKGERSKNYESPRIEASVNVERMRTSPGRIIDQARLYMKLAANGLPEQLEMDAQIGEGDFYLRFKPIEGGLMSMDLQADDTGATLKAFNIYDNALGGQLVLKGTSRSAANPYLLEGKSKITNIRVADAPVLAQIVNALTLTSIPELLNNEGIVFSTMKANFEWAIRTDGDLYIIHRGRTSGASLGLTFEGSINKRSNQTDISGTVVPVSMFNQLLSNIPLVGDILTGGRDGAIFAATYSIKGPLKTPTVTVNPLAALTPGILRKLFFEDSSPGEDIDDDEFFTKE